ncbi:MAG: hypothetical protein LBT54_00150, partial [Bifidobacteriaceae bacterium]|nr:hypothetical protein [Bifidobacteriaceae bacterium]
RWAAAAGFSVSAVPDPHLLLWGKEVVWRILGSPIARAHDLPLPDPSLRGPIPDEVVVSDVGQLAGSEVKFDINDDVPSTVTTPVKVRFATHLGVGLSAQVAVEVRQAEDRLGGTQRYILDRDGDRWRGVVGPLPPGTWWARAAVAKSGLTRRPTLESQWRPVLSWPEDPYDPVLAV